MHAHSPILAYSPRASEFAAYADAIRDHADRDAIANELMRYRDQTGDDWADITTC